MVHTIRELVAAPDADSAQRFIAMHPEVRQLEVVGLLVNRSHGAAARDKGRLAERLGRVVALLVGSSDEGRQRLVADLASVSHALKGPQPSYAETAEAIRLVDEMGEQDDLSDLSPELVPAVWDATAHMATRLHRLTTNQRWNASALRAARLAAQATPPDDPGIVLRQEVLAHHLAEEFEQVRDPAILAEAVALSMQVAEATPAEDPSAARRLNNLAVRMARQFELDGNRTVLDRAVAFARAAVDNTPADSPDLAGRLNNLANRLGQLYALTRTPTARRAVAMASAKVAGSGWAAWRSPRWAARFDSNVGSSGPPARAQATARRVVAIASSSTAGVR
ncbi:MAG: hypothetical protein AAGK32_10620, partial [Actinomycetota bacterium]